MRNDIWLWGFFCGVIIFGDWEVCGLCWFICIEDGADGVKIIEFDCIDFSEWGLLEGDMFRCVMRYWDFFWCDVFRFDIECDVKRWYDFGLDVILREEFDCVFFFVDCELDDDIEVEFWWCVCIDKVWLRGCDFRSKFFVWEEYKKFCFVLEGFIVFG